MILQSPRIGIGYAIIAGIPDVREFRTKYAEGACQVDFVVLDVDLQEVSLSVLLRKQTLSEGDILEFKGDIDDEDGMLDVRVTYDTNTKKRLKGALSIVGRYA